MNSRDAVHRHVVVKVSESDTFRVSRAGLPSMIGSDPFLVHFTDVSSRETKASLPVSYIRSGACSHHHAMPCTPATTVQPKHTVQSSWPLKSSLLPGATHDIPLPIAQRVCTTWFHYMGCHEMSSGAQHTNRELP